LLALAQPEASAEFVILHSYHGYTTNLPLEALLDDDVIIAHSVLVAPLKALQDSRCDWWFPQRYAWKSAKWL
jgi:DMSO/TMAO reductase YedYZ molybdopterin-dependent catalytic subunit